MLDVWAVKGGGTSHIHTPGDTFLPSYPLNSAFHPVQFNPFYAKMFKLTVMGSHIATMALKGLNIDYEIEVSVMSCTLVS